MSNWQLSVRAWHWRAFISELIVAQPPLVIASFMAGRSDSKI
jgi:hypothetical protein